MTWNYRAIKEIDHDEELYRVHEVYYNKAGELDRWMVEPTCPQGETLEDLRAELAMILAYVRDHPALDMAELRARFPQEERHAGR